MQISKLLNRVGVAEGTMAFHFEKPPGFDFRPGRSVDVRLLNPREVDSVTKIALMLDQKMEKLLDETNA